MTASTQEHSKDHSQEHCRVALCDSHLQNTQQLYGDKLAALDGDIGEIKDFYFDDKNWVIRYLVADTGSWLTGRLVLLSPHAFGKLDQYEKTLHVNLRKMQIQDSPSIDAHKPVSRQYEMEYYRYYSWPTYWDGGGLWGLGGYPMPVPPSKEEVNSFAKYHHREDKHLQSTRVVTDYEIQAKDGPIGHVSGFLVDERSWAIHQVVVEAGHWYSGKQILVAPTDIERIGYEESKVYVSVSKDDIRRTAENALVKAQKDSPGTKSCCG
jgi:hypothetical protein